MLVKLADKLTLSAPAPQPSEVTTDPVELGRFNRAAAILVVHYAHGDMVFAYSLEVSDDLEAWDRAGSDDGFTIGPASAPPREITRGVPGRYLRARLGLSGGSSGVSSHICVDLKARLDVESPEAS